MKTRKSIFLVLIFIEITSFGQGFNPEECNNISKNLNINGRHLMVQMKDNNSFKGICDTVFSFATPTNYPLGVTWDEEYLWHSDKYGEIFKIDTLGNLIDTITLPNYISGLGCDGTYLYGVNEQNALLYKISISDGTYDSYSLPTFNPTDPNLWGASYGGGYLWVSEYGGSYDIFSRLYKIDPVTIDVLDTVFVKKDILAVEWINNLLFGINTNSNEIYKIDPMNGSLLDSADWCIPVPYGFTFEDKYVWSVSGNNLWGGNEKVYKIDSVSFITSIFDYKKDNNLLLSIYPNPSNQEIKIEINHKIMHKEMICEIMNLEGQIIRNIKLTNQKSKIYIGDLKRGLYFIRVKSDNGIVTKKFIKND